MQQIHLWTAPTTPNIGHRDAIHQLCATTLEVIHEADRLLILLNVVDIERQSLDKKVEMRGGGVWCWILESHKKGLGSHE